MDFFFIINPGEVTNQRGSHTTGAMLYLNQKHESLTEHVVCGIFLFVCFIWSFIISSISRIYMWAFLNGLIDVVLLSVMT